MVNRRFFKVVIDEFETDAALLCLCLFQLDKEPYMLLIDPIPLNTEEDKALKKGDHYPNPDRTVEVIVGEADIPGSGLLDDLVVDVPLLTGETPLHDDEFLDDEDDDRDDFPSEDFGYVEFSNAEDNSVVEWLEKTWIQETGSNTNEVLAEIKRACLENGVSFQTFESYSERFRKRL